MLFSGSALRMDGAIHVGVVQGIVSHAVHWLRSLSTAKHDGRLVDHGQYADRCHVLCSVRRPLHDPHPVVRHLTTTLPREGSNEAGSLSTSIFLSFCSTVNLSICSCAFCSQYLSRISPFCSISLSQYQSVLLNISFPVSVRSAQYLSPSTSPFCLISLSQYQSVLLNIRYSCQLY